jgi:shikimate dehydrogenase
MYRSSNAARVKYVMPRAGPYAVDGEYNNGYGKEPERLMEINGGTRLTGLIGSDIVDSPSPALHNAAYETLGMNWAYLPLRVGAGQLMDALEGLRAAGFVGVNVTIPHKLEAARLVDELRGDARVLNTVNTVHFAEAGIYGYNTDTEGLLRSMREAGVASVASVFMIGAGGAARAAALALSRLGARTLYIFNRNRERAGDFMNLVKREGIFDEIYIREYDEIGARILADCSCVVNSTPLARCERGELPLDYGLFGSGQVAVDLGYLEHRSAFLREAEGRGALAINGRPMLLYQAAEAFRVWTGTEPPVEGMRQALEEKLMDHCSRARSAGGRDGET